MYLNDESIVRLLLNGTLKIEHLSDPARQIQPASVDLKLAPVFRVFRQENVAYLDPYDHQPKHYTEVVEVPHGTPFIIHPGQFVLGSTRERISLPAHLLARCEGKSSLGRLGILIHATAGFLDPGFEGNVTLEISNVGPLPVSLWPGMRICQIAYCPLTGPAVRPYGSAGRGSKYHHQGHAEPARLDTVNLELTPEEAWEHLRAIGEEWHVTGS